MGYIRSAEEQVIDQVLITLFGGPHSYTGENTIEISCHGSSYIQSAIIDRLAASAPGRQAGESLLSGLFTMASWI
ncbi:MAG: hypothetical protein IPP04_02985 [Saprospiraceae bacterium]|nr:hypothetical protein [Saprospiraceae bacterium]